ncbi:MULTISPECIES: DEAD/DEAH box helicase [Pseudomonas]|uniref:Helicase SNF2 n=1 Tax=Pseudomonas putida TaxID=303 RepID=A0A1L7NA66_PSEPU|nr:MULTISPECIES: DEAD/DEAH box helicase [Pseudomonas]MBP2084373.1 SNF2 family DNA or RNA helicase [Pseudomonas sp. PvP089]MBP2089926.1 SNF2 family DNA or RNA helicase [Pseudomonas sp. PvP088]MBP2223911.1 SNF2 family DNA or RNA helicase [Pseudomonas putida]MDO1496985.1 DEAD/DEAH box helicase [Pseudomonas putida]PMY81084.1 helicase SNF2 [Pseudomonas sp. FW306-2-2C-D06B]
MKQDAAEMVNAYPNWTQSFSKAALQRGERYAEEGRVELEGFYGPTITANCQGSGDNHYRQSIELHVAGGRCHVHGECDCPVGQNCKHCAAALFCISDPWSNHEATQADPATLSAELQHWLSGLEQAPPKPNAAEDKRGRMVCYQLDLTDDAGCALLVRKGTRTEDGIRFSRVQSLYDFLYEPPRFVTEEDTRILRLLSALNQGGGQDRGYKLKGQEGGELFQRALETGRMFYDVGFPPLHQGPVRHAEFRWVRLDNGNYRGLWYSGEEMLRCVIPLLPLYYFDLLTSEVGKVEHSLDPHVAVQLTIAPDVPEHLVVPLSHKLNALSHKVPTPTPVQEQLLDHIQPKAILALGSLEYTAYMPKTGRMQRQMQHRAALAFNYDGLQVSGTDEKPLTRLAGSTSQRIRRQPQAELALRNALRDLGFKPATRQSKALPDSAGEMYQLPDDEAWLRFAREGLPRLREAGWNIDIHRDFAFNLQEVDDWYATIDEAPGHEWFDLELGIVVDGQRHSLLPIVLQLLRSSPELLRPSELARRSDDEHLLIDLNRGRLDTPALRVALPYGRIKAVMGTLGELYLHEDTAGPSLRMERADAARLNEIEGLPLHWEGGEHVRDLGRRLRDARELQVPPPAGLRANLRPYQQQGLNWLQALRGMGTGGILGDDMGLGKTLQTLAHLLLEKDSGRLGAPALAVMPTSLIPNWLDEAQRFAPDLRVLALHGPGRSKHFTRLHEYDLVLTTYALMPRDLEHLRAQAWHMLVLDEAQNIKSSTSKAALAVCELQAGQRLCLTGTPMENNLGELWSIFHFLMPGWLGDLKRFNQDYRVPIERHGDAERLAHLVTRIRPFLLRRTKEQVATELPAKTEMVHWVELSDAQRDTYEAVRVAMDQKVRDEIARNGAARSQIVILDALLKLRQVCCDLRLVKGVESHGNQADKGKLGALLEMLEELLSEGRRVLLFSQFTSMLALIEQELQKRKIRYSLLTGDTRDRRTPVRQFQQGDSEVFLISLKAGGVGLNLTAADTVIHYDPWWNPASENQATDRAYRIGQDKPVFVFKLITRGTVEEKIQMLQQEKAALAASLLDGGQAGQWRMGDEEIEALFAPLPGKRGR